MYFSLNAWLPRKMKCCALITLIEMKPLWRNHVLQVALGYSYKFLRRLAVCIVCGWSTTYTCRIKVNLI